MNEENQTNTTVQSESPKPRKGGAAKKVIIAVVALIVIVAIVMGILLATGVLNVNLSKKSKMIAGVEKIGERFSTTMDDLSGSSKDSSKATIKIFNNLNKDSEVEFAGDVSANVDSFDVSRNVYTVDESTVKTILDIINSSKLGMNIKYAGKENVAASINGKIDDVELSGEVVYDGEKVAMRSQEINKKWLAYSKEDIEKMLEDQEIDLDQISEMSSKMQEKIVEMVKSTEIDEKTQNEIEERYNKVLKDFVNNKSKNIESEKDKVKVDGKNKNCEKLTLELNGDDVKDLLIEYVDTFKADKQLQEIIKKSFSTYSDVYNEIYTSAAGTIAEATGEYTSLPEDLDLLDELFSDDSINDLKDEIKDLDLDVKVVLTVYATNTDVYRTDITIESNKTEFNFEMTFNKEETVIDVSVKSAGVKIDVATITIKSEKNNASIKVETSEALEDYIGERISLEMNIKNEENRSELSLSANLGKNGKAALAIVSNVTKNEDNEYADETVLDFDIDIKNVVTTKGSLKINSNIKVGNVSIPSISSSDTVDATDQSAVEAYMTESQTNIVELIDKISKIEGLSDLIDIPELLDVPENTSTPDDTTNPDAE